MARKRKRRTPRIVVDIARTPPATPPRRTRLQTAGIVARNLVPLVGLLVLGQSAGQFVLLSVFNLALAIAGIGMVGIAVSLHGKYVGTADRIAAFSLLVAVGLGIVAVLTGLFGWAIALYIEEVEGTLFERSLLWSVLSLLLCALPALWQQYDADVRAGLDEAARKRRDQPQVFIHLLSAGLIFIYTPYAFGLERVGMLVAAVVITAMFTFRDLRPDLMEQLAPALPSTAQDRNSHE